MGNSQDFPNMRPASQSGSYFSDAPVRERQEDRFKRWPFAERISQVIASRNDPASIVIGIYGAWGDGKTSVLNFVEKSLSENSQIVCLRFNPWRFRDEESLLGTFFGLIASALKTRLKSRGEEAGEALKKYAGLLSLAWSGASEAAKTVGASLDDASLDDLKSRIEEALAKSALRVVILIDDVDRLEKHEVQALFKLVKLTGDFKQTAYVLAFDDQMVASALGERFTAEEQKRYGAGYSFLEKIIQVPLNLPPPDQDELRGFCFEGVDEALRSASIELKDAQSQRFVRTFFDGLEIRLRTPRMARRYANALTFALGILRRETYPVDVMLIEGIRVFYPVAYDVVRRNAEVVLGSGSRDRGSDAGKIKKFMGECTAGLTTTETAALTEVLEQLFPRLGGTIYGSEWEDEWAKEKRICARSYFARYFSYAIADSDVADGDVEALICAGEESFRERFVALLTPRNSLALVGKLRHRASDMDPAVACRLIGAIAANGSRFQRLKSFFPFTDPFSQAAILVSNLIRSLPDQDRPAQAETVALQASPLEFAAECMRWIVRSDRAEDRTLAEANEKGVTSAFANRAKTEWARSYDETGSVPHNLALILGMWRNFGDPADISAALTEKIKQKPEFVLELLKSWLGVSWGMTTGISSPGDLDRNSYDAVSRLLPAETVYEALVGIYGPALERPVYEGAASRSLDDTVAHQFAYIHRAATKGPEAETPQLQDAWNPIQERPTGGLG